MKKRITNLFICVVLAFTFAACGRGKSGDKGGPQNPGEIEFWSKYGTEKILQDRTDLWDAVKLPAAVEVEACKGEYESVQVIMTATKDVSSYNAEITDLAPSGGTGTFKKEYISLRHQKYIQVTTNYSNNGAPTGWYPDALVPLESIIAAGENNIKAGKNQGLYITFNVPASQPAGAYAGSLKITYDGKEKVLPVKLTVYGFTVSQETRSASYFNLGFTQHLGELDSTPEMWSKYAETLCEYRLSASRIAKITGSSLETMRRYADDAYNLVKNYGLSTINSPWPFGDDLKEFLVILAKKSIKEGIDLVAKVVSKGADEPKADALESVEGYTNSFRKSLIGAEDEFDALKARFPGNDAFIEQLKVSVRKIPYIIAFTYDRGSVTDKYDIDTWCPLFDKYDTPEGRAKYKDATSDLKGRWWYGCVYPRPPYPTYHTEDTLVSARSVGWMMSEYDVTGNLYWSATVYSRYESVYMPIEDYYTGNARRFTNVNGDGYLFYPGAHYGIYGPVASIRLEAIRDGNEEYEILYDLREAYKNAGVSPDAVQRNISSLIYSGTKVASTSQQFAAARKALIQLAMLAASPAEVCIAGVSDDGKGTVTYEITAKNGYVIKNNGAALTGSTAGGRTTYTLVIKREDERNALALSVEANGAEYRLDFDLGGKVAHYEAEELLGQGNAFTNGNASVSAALEGGKIKLDIGAVVSGHQNVRYTSSVLSAMDAGTQRFVLHIQNPTGSDITFRILAKFENDPLNIELYGGNLKPGMNQISVNVGGNIASKGKLSHAEFYFNAAGGSHPAKTVYIDGLSIYRA